MVKADDFARPKSEQDSILAHEITFYEYREFEKLRKMTSDTPIPIPRIGENLILVKKSLTEEDGDVVWETGDRILPETEEATYQVQSIDHEYAFVDPDEELEGGYKQGMAVYTDILVVEMSSEYPV